MIDNPMLKVIERMTSMAILHGTAFCRITWDADKEVFNFSVIHPKYVTVDYDEKKHD